MEMEDPSFLTLEPSNGFNLSSVMAKVPLW